MQKHVSKNNMPERPENMPEQDMRKQASRTNEAKQATCRKIKHARATIRHALLYVKFVCVWSYCMWEMVCDKVMWEMVWQSCVCVSVCECVWESIVC